MVTVRAGAYASAFVHPPEEGAPVSGALCVEKERLRVSRKYEKWLTEEGLLQITGWARDGLTDKQIAKNCSCSLSAFKEWKKRFPELAEALRKGKDVVDREVENALYKSAVGYVQTLRKPVKIRIVEYDPATGKKVSELERWITVEEEVLVPAQVTAQIFWLKNRKPDLWRERQAEATDTTALDKLDAILAETIKNAYRETE